MPYCEENAGLWDSQGLRDRAACLGCVVQEGFLEEVPSELKREKKRSRESLTELRRWRLLTGLHVCS